MSNTSVTNLVTNVEDSNFEEVVLKSDIPVLVDFWAEYCGPCKAIAPILVDVASEYANKIKIVKLDVQQNQQKSMEYKIRSIPALLIFKNGKFHAQHIGSLNKNQLKTFIESNIGI